MLYFPWFSVVFNHFKIFHNRASHQFFPLIYILKRLYRTCIKKRRVLKYRGDNIKMRILIFGASGYAGSFIKQILEMRSHFVIGTYKTYRPQFSYDSHMVQYNLEDQKGLSQLLNNINPDIIISCLNGDFKEQLKAHEIMLNF